MGFIKSIFLGLVSLLIILSIIASLFFASAYTSLEYNNLKDSTNQVLFSYQNELIDSLETEIVEMEKICKENDFIETNDFIIPCQTIYLGKEESNNFLITQNISFSLNDSYYGYLNDYCSSQEKINTTLISGAQIELSCSDILDKEKNFQEFAFEPIFESIYNQKYDCGFYSCIKKDPLSLFSSQSYNYMKSRFYTINIILIIFSLLLVFFSNKFSNSIIYLGTLFLISTFSFKFLKESVLSFFENLLKKVSFLIDSSQVTQITQVLFKESLTVIRIYYILGFVLISFGIGFYIYQRFFGSKTWTKSEIKKMINKN